jgi:hypothetical protein
MKQTALQLLKEDIDYEMKSGTKMVVNWDMYLEKEKQQMMYAYNSDRDLLSCYDDGSAFNDYYNETYGGESKT